MVDQDRHGREVVDGAVEEALDLAGMEVDADQPAGTGRREHVGHQLGGDGLPARRLAVLAGVAVVRADRGDALRRCPAGGIDHDQLLHQGVVDGRFVRAAVRLDDEGVAPPDGLTEAAVDLTVGELGQVGLAQLLAEFLGDLLGERSAGPSGDQVERLVGDQFHGALSSCVAYSRAVRH